MPTMTTTTNTRVRTVNPNRFSGTCRTCGRPVAPGEGFAIRPRDHWQTYHMGCPVDLDAASRPATPQARVTQPKADPKMVQAVMRVQGVDEESAEGAILADTLGWDDRHRAERLADTL